VVGLVGEVKSALLAELTRFSNVSVARAPAHADYPAGDQPATARAGWEAGADAMREAARRRSTYVIVPEDPLADVAAQWRAMWQVASAAPGAADFEAAAADALAAWRGKRFELPDYYLVIAPAVQDAAEPDLYLGPLRAVRPHRVAVAGISDSRAQSTLLLDTLRSLEHGPWWPPLDELLDSARHFYAGALTVPAGPTDVASSSQPTGRSPLPNQ
jgi:hypothetical protein